MPTEEVLINERKAKLAALAERGINPYPNKFIITAHSTDLHKKYASLKEEEHRKDKVSVAGRIIALRRMGKVTFMHLLDARGKQQVYCAQDVLVTYDLLKLLDRGDWIGITGTIFKTKTGEVTVQATELTLLSKSLRPLPEKWHGLKDVEERFRKRYLDAIMNPEVRDLVYKKSRFWDTTRSFMKEKGFVEVETPTLELTTGGAEARPFTTHHNDFDIDVHLRISIGELWQKRMMAAGFEKTFEIGRAYRNEGSSPEHLQEFTNMEFYWGFANYEMGMQLAQELYQVVAKETFGTTKFTARGFSFDLAGEWPRIDYQEEIKKQTGIDILEATLDQMKQKLHKLHIKYDGDTRERLTDTLWKFCRKNIAGPAFLINHPKAISPLAKESPTKPGLTERFQIIIAGSEIGNGYSELNDPIDQRKRFEEQQALLDRGDEEAMMPDWDFVEMLEYGMPPTCGFGFGDRFFSFLVDKPLRECQFFPLMKPVKE